MIMVGEEDAGLQRRIRAYNRQVFEEFEVDHTANAQSTFAGLVAPLPGTTATDRSDRPPRAPENPTQVKTWKRVLEMLFVLFVSAPLAFISVHFIRYFTPHDSGKNAFEDYWQTTFDFALIAAFAAFLFAGLIAGFGGRRRIRAALRVETLWALVLLALFLMMLLDLV